MTSNSPPPGDDRDLPGGFFQLNTDHLPGRDRMEFWYETTGRRMKCTPNGRTVNARLHGLQHDGIELLDYASEAFMMDRDRTMCRRDDRDEISIGLVAGTHTGTVQNGNELSLQTGELYVIDFSQPVRSTIPDHHEISLFLPRRLVTSAIGISQTDKLGGLRLSGHGIGGLLASHLQALAREAALLTPGQQRIALRSAMELALAALQSAGQSPVDVTRFATGLYAAALRLITQHCADHSFGPDRLAALLGWSRARLYRLFRDHGSSAGAAIREARLNLAHHMLTSPGRTGLRILEVALLCGFTDHATFSRMFRERYGITPRQARETLLR